MVANSVHPDQIPQDQSDVGLHCFSWDPVSVHSYTRQLKASGVFILRGLGTHFHQTKPLLKSSLL